jgi:hypothetical protein
LNIEPLLSPSNCRFLQSPRCLSLIVQQNSGTRDLRRIKIDGPKNGPFFKVKRIPTCALTLHSVPPRSFPHISTITVANMDKATQVLIQGVPPGVPSSYRALADHGKVPRSTLHHRAQGRRSIEEKALSQQYLTPCEAKAVVDFLLQIANLGQPMRMKYIPSIAFSTTRQRPLSDRSPQPPGKNWAKAFETRYPQLKVRRVKALDWNRHKKNIYKKITHWFEVIGAVLQDSTVLEENVYNMDKTGVMLSMPGSIKVLVGNNDMRDYRGARIKRTLVTAIECISADGRYLTPMIIWPATTHRSNWTTFS